MVGKAFFKDCAFLHRSDSEVPHSPAVAQIFKIKNEIGFG
jgi:hypothetical protein